MMLQGQSGLSSASHRNRVPKIAVQALYTQQTMEKKQHLHRVNWLSSGIWILSFLLWTADLERKQGGMAPSLIALEMQFVVNSTEINTARSLPF